MSNENGPSRSSWFTLAATATLIAAAGVVYAPSFQGRFLFDDYPAIYYNPNIRSLWPIWTAMSAPPSSPMTGRPLVNLTFAINYALGGLDPWGYHAFNLAVHVLAALVLFGLVRRIPMECGGNDAALAGLNARPRIAAASAPLALAVATIWVVHPLTTAAVTYIVQRDESLAALLYLLTLYLALRGMTADCPRRWFIAAVLCCAAGIATKETVATAPLMVLLIDRLLVSGSFKESLARRWRLYAGLAGTWAIAAAILIASPRQELQASTGFGIDATCWQYARSQFAVILHYLGLCFWPHPLILDYGWPVANSWLQIVPQAVAVGALLAGVAWAMRRSKLLAVAGAAFFVVLAPTSSVIPLKDLAFEHRMYLPLAAVIAIVVVGAYALWLRLWRGLSWLPARGATIAATAILAAVVAALGWATFQRNIDYQDDIAFLTRNMNLTPNNPRPRMNLAAALVLRGQVTHDPNSMAQGMQEYRQLLKTWPDYPPAHYNLATDLARLARRVEDLDEPRQHFEEVVRLWPRRSEGYQGLGMLWDYRFGLTRDPNDANAAIGCFEEWARLSPLNDEPITRLAVVLHKRGDVAGAIQRYRQALSINPDNPVASYNLGLHYLQSKRVAQAIPLLQAAVRGDPANVNARFNLAQALLAAGDVTAAAEQLQEVLRLNPADAEARQLLDAIRQGAYRPRS